jgi:endonuclease YncB( thermonuclease family)
MILLATVLCSSLVVTDGDTFVCNDERIRVLGLDAPETYFAKCDVEVV